MPSRPVPMQPSGPPLRLLDEPLRLLLAAAAEALASMPGTLYPAVYVGPLQSADVLRKELRSAAEASGVGFMDWIPETEPPVAPTILLVSWETVDEASRACAGMRGQQLVAWGEKPVDALPEGTRDLFARPDALVLDPRNRPGTPAPTAALCTRIGRAAMEPSSGANPVVVIAPTTLGRQYVDLAELYLDALGHTRGSTLQKPCEAGRGPARASVVHLTSEADAMLCATAVASARGTGVTTILVCDPTTWERVRTSGQSGQLLEDVEVLRVGDPSSDTGSPSPAWPRVPSLWVGAPTSGPDAPDDALLLPAGTPLFEALSHLDVRARPGRVAAWTGDRIAIITVALCPLGAAVVDVRVAGQHTPTSREAALAAMDEIRGWPELRTAVLAAAAGARGGMLMEPVQRVGFYFSRRDDERPADQRIAPSPERPGVYAVARELVGLGLVDTARALLRRAERDSGWSVESEVLLGYLVAEADPDEAVMRLRHAALRLASDSGRDDAWALQTDATLNALLLMVRTGQVAPVEAWGSVEGWLAHADTRWVSSARHAAVLFELAVRAGQGMAARRFADLFRAMAAPGEPLADLLEPVFQSVLERAP